MIKSPLHIGTLSSVDLRVNTNTNNILLLKMAALVSLNIYKDQKQEQVQGYTLKGKWGGMKKIEKEVHFQTRSILLCRAG